MSTRNRRALLALVPVLFAMLTLTFAVPTRAQTAYPVHHKNWIQRHPTLTGIGAGIATHHALKVAAARDKASGRRLNWAERHPTMSGLGVGVATHHIIKKTTH